MPLRMLALALVAFLASPTLLAEEAVGDVERAKRHVEQAERHYQLAEFDDAVREFQAAYRLVPRPGILFNLGQCYLQMKQYEKAAFSYRAYLRAEPEAPNKALVEELIEQAEQAAAEEERRLREAATVASASSSDAVLSAGLTTASLGAGIAVASFVGVGIVELLLLVDPEAEQARTSWGWYERALLATGAMGVTAALIGGTLMAVAIVE